MCVQLLQFSFLKDEEILGLPGQSRMRATAVLHKYYRSHEQP